MSKIYPRAFLGSSMDPYAHLLPVVQALVVVLEDGAALLLAGVIFSGGVDNVAGEDVLPEGEAS